jgi:hypothetical protein
MRPFIYTDRRVEALAMRMKVCVVISTRTLLICPGPKLSIAVFQNNLIIVSPPFLPTATSASATVRHYVSKTNINGESSGPADIAKITVFDLQNKLVAYSGTFRDGVREVVCQWGGIFVYGGNGKVSLPGLRL